MEKINFKDIEDKINESNYLAEGKEATCYNIGDEVIKIFHEDRKSELPMISIEGLEKLSTLSLKHFNRPLALIYNNKELVGYKEKLLHFSDFDINKTDINYFIGVLEEIKEDIKILSDNGFLIEDLFYNYAFDNGNLEFFDLTSYKYINVNNDYVRDFYFIKNLQLVNIFLVALIQFGAFKKGEKNEYTKIYNANQYIIENMNGQYFGDYLIKNMSESNTIFKNS